MKVLWCHSHLVWLVLRLPSLHALVFIQKSFMTCSLTGQWHLVVVDKGVEHVMAAVLRRHEVQHLPAEQTDLEREERRRGGGRKEEGGGRREEKEGRKRGGGGERGRGGRRGNWRRQ